MHKRTIPIAVALTIALLPLQPTGAFAATSDGTLPPAEIQQVGPGQYFPDTRTFEVSQSDVSVGSIGRRHGVVAAAVDGGLARPESALASRPELAVFGPSWEAEFLGGTINRKLETQADAIVVTDLAEGSPTRYDLRGSVSYPGGGGVQKYEDADGSKIVETTRWDSAAGVMRTSISETVATGMGAPEAGDDAFTDANGTPINLADLNVTYDWDQPSGVPGADTWRVTGAGTKAHGISSVTYDSQGRVSTIKEPAAGETPEELLTIGYAASTTATTPSFGDYTGRVKEITLTVGTSTPRTVARYAYDPSGLLRTVTNPAEAAEPQAAYSYDALGRLASVDSADNGDWDLTFAAGTAVPQAASTGPARVPGSPLQGPAGINDPNATGPNPADFVPGDLSDAQAYPRACSSAASWLWSTRYGCASWVAHYGWRAPSWKQLPTGSWVVGISHDHCTRSPDKPSGFDFRSACDMHDYGYGLIGNTWKNYWYYLDRDRKAQVDDVFHTTLREYTCTKYGWRKKICRSVAWGYRQGVRSGSPKNGANAT